MCPSPLPEKIDRIKWKIFVFPKEPSVILSFRMSQRVQPKRNAKAPKQHDGYVYYDEYSGEKKKKHPELSPVLKRKASKKRERFLKNDDDDNDKTYHQSAAAVVSITQNDTAGTTQREKRSLAVLGYIVLSMMRNSPAQQFRITENVFRTIGFQKRRVYDVIGAFEGAGLVVKSHKGPLYHWIGKRGFQDLLEAIRASKDAAHFVSKIPHRDKGRASESILTVDEKEEAEDDAYDRRYRASTQKNKAVKRVKQGTLLKCRFFAKMFIYTLEKHFAEKLWDVDTIINRTVEIIDEACPDKYTRNANRRLYDVISLFRLIGIVYRVPSEDLYPEEASFPAASAVTLNGRVYANGGDGAKRSGSVVKWKHRPRKFIWCPEGLNLSPECHVEVPVPSPSPPSVVSVTKLSPSSSFVSEESLADVKHEKEKDDDDDDDMTTSPAKRLHMDPLSHFSEDSLGIDAAAETITLPEWFPLYDEEENLEYRMDATFLSQSLSDEFRALAELPLLSSDRYPHGPIVPL